jgi:serine protease AprX
MKGFKKSYSVWLLTFILFSLHFETSAQIHKYLVYFTDKSASPFSTNNPSQFLSSRSIQRRVNQGIAITSRDLPVNPAYIDSVKSKGATVWYTSRWFNAALVLADSLQMAAVKALGCVQNSSKVNRIGSSASPQGSQAVEKINSSPAYGSSLNQISMLGADVMHSEGFHGEGMQIAILDAGFQNANVLSNFDSLFFNNQILSTYDFVSNENNVFDNDEHGTMVLSTLGAYAAGQLIGTAYKASYHLIRTEDAASESLIEEFNWLLGAEYADSAGADIISSSLGYTTFDDPSTNHTYADLDGKTTMVTRAANMAASAGIVVVNSAGNEGSNSWKYIVAPADSDSVLAIGGVDASANYVSFSSQGPSASGHIKPDLAAKALGTTVSNASNAVVGASGTSFACPLVAGLAAGVWQAYPNLNSFQVRDLLKRSGSRECHPDDFLGYGIPNFERVREIMGSSFASKTYIYPSPFNDEPLSLIINPILKGKDILVRMMELDGRFLDDQLIKNACLNNRLSLNTYELRSGMYLIQVISGNQSFTFKVVKI